VPERERALDAFHAAVRRILLGYDRRRDIDAQLHALLDTPLPSGLAPEFLIELAEIRAAIGVFADTETLFSRQPPMTPGGGVGRSNDACLRLYLRRLGARGAGLPDAFLTALRRGLAHYRLGELTPGAALERALLRLYAAQARRDERHRLAAALLRYVTRLAAAGVDCTADEALLATLGTCIALRGTVPDALADAAVEARYTIFELPAIRRRAAAAALALEAGPAIDGPGVVAVELDTLRGFADSPPEVFERIGGWARSGDAARRDVALQALVLRQYMPLVARCEVRTPKRATVNLARLDYGEHGVVWASLAPLERIGGAWHALRDAIGQADPRVLLELFVTTGVMVPPDALAALVAPSLTAAPIDAARVCITALQADGSRRHATYGGSGGGLAPRTDLLDVHPETARRIGLDRLVEFELERLPSSEGLYAFYGRSRAIPTDERIFVLAEVRAAMPGAQGTLHELAFVHAFAEAVRTLRAIRGERDQWRRLHWNRITLVVRPALYLLPATLDRLLNELLPATRHLGLEKIVVRLTLRDAPSGGVERRQELVVEPTAGGRVQVVWRAPHHEPLRPASVPERRLAEARRRGLIHPHDAIRLLTAADGARFVEYGRGAPSEAPCGIVFGLISTPTAKHPEGMERVLVVSDPTHNLGALAAPECERLVAALDLAAERGVPLEWIATSAGARIAMDSGTENLDATARVVRRIVTFTGDGGEINVVVAGVNVGAQSYFNALATMLIPTRGVLIMLSGAAMVLTGRLALEASGGVAAEDEAAIGGFDRIMGPNGEAQYVARDLAHALEILLEHYRHTYRAPGEAGPRRQPTRDPALRSIAEFPYPAEAAGGFATVGDIFDDAANPGRKQPFAMRPVMQALIDQDGGWLERWATMAGAETAIVWDAHLGGHPVCLIGIESQNVPRLGHGAPDGPDEWTAGTLFPLSSKKIARAIAAASGNRPVVVVANLSGFDGSPESMRTLQLEYGAEIARAVVGFDGPFLFAVVSRYHGGAYVVFSRALNDRVFSIALEGSFASVIGGSAAATTVFGREVQARTDADTRLQAAAGALRAARGPEHAAALTAELERVREQVTLEQHGAVARAFDAVHTVERARAVGSLDAIVAVADLRRRLIERLEESRTED
jgi:acetyl-CoA carboxylase carboxyltransferase component